MYYREGEYRVQGAGWNEAGREGGVLSRVLTLSHNPKAHAEVKVQRGIMSNKSKGLSSC